jgi:L-galactose dehydrogenase
MQYRTLGKTGLSVSAIGFGASTLGNVFAEISPSGDATLVGRAIDAGINFFDVSPYYGFGLAEERLGSALMPYRKDVVLATKCGRYGADQFDFSAKGIVTLVEKSLRRLRTDAVDLLQAHDIEFGDINQVIQETLPALAELKRQGKARFIGITGYWPNLLTKIAQEYSVDTVLNYCHSNLFADDMNLALIPAAQASGFGLINASPLHMGLLGGGAIPDWHPAPNVVRKAAKVVIDLCRSRQVEPASLAIWNSLQNTAVAMTLVGLANVSQLNSACEALTLKPDKELLWEISKVIAPAHNLSWPQGRPENQDRSFLTEPTFAEIY